LITCYASVIGGGCNNCSCERSVVAGGDTNYANATLTTIGGGQLNRACAGCSSILGGQCNTLSATHTEAAIVGSCINSVSAKALHANTLVLVLSDVPSGCDTANLVPGAIYNDSGTLKIKT